MAFELKAALGSGVGQIRTSNEDAAFILLSPVGGRNTCALILVADGWQGNDGNQGTGRVASELVANAVRQELEGLIQEPGPSPQLSASRLTELLHSAVAKANTDLCFHQGKLGIVTGLACLLIWNELAAIVNNADCHVYLLRNDSLRRITNNHGWLSDRQRAASAYGAALGTTTTMQINWWAQHSRIDREFARQANSSAAVQVNVWSETLRPGDRLLMGCDGLWGPLGDDNLALFLRESETPELAVQRLIEAANAGGGPDNITAIVCDVVAQHPIQDDRRI